MNPESSVPGGDRLYAPIPTARRRFISFDGGVAADGLLQRPDRYRFWSTAPSPGHRIPRGAGLSYAAASFSQRAVSVEHGDFNRILDFDADSGIVEVEAGIELAVLYEFLASHGMYLPVQPGHGRITVGGCIAADVHGKNHARDGTFVNQVLSLTLFHPTHGEIHVARETEPSVFWLTCGGYGLTGHILRARLKASLMPSSHVELRAAPFPHAFSGIDDLAENASQADFAYTWHDMMRTGGDFGRGYLLLGSIRADARQGRHGVLANAIPSLSAEERASWRLPLLNRWTTYSMNLAYSTRERWHGRVRNVQLRDALFPIHETQFYFKLFGRTGFHEYQVLVPRLNIAQYLQSVQDFLNHHPLAITLASAKLFRGQQQLLRFTGEGICIALNFPRSRESIAFTAFLDKLVVSVKGIPNIIKDSRLPRAVMDACYPDADRFRRELRAFDPGRLFQSELSERLDL
jgi:decaprenylphospho-beta-D-ribofuranose 2-oxidase